MQPIVTICGSSLLIPFMTQQPTCVSLAPHHESRRIIDSVNCQQTPFRKTKFWTIITSYFSISHFIKQLITPLGMSCPRCLCWEEVEHKLPTWTHLIHLVRKLLYFTSTMEPSPTIIYVVSLHSCYLELE